MMILRFIARIAVIAVVTALLTRWTGWIAIPFAGFLYGFADRKARAHGSIAAIGAMAGWLAILGISASTGNDVGAVADRIGGVLQVSGWMFLLLTLAFAALLCGTAAVLGAALGGFHENRFGTGRQPRIAGN